MGKTLILLKDSTYSIDPPTGKLLFRYEDELQKRELPLVSPKEVDPLIPYPLLNPLQSLFYYEYKEGSALVCAPTSAGKSLIAYLFMRDKEGRKIYTAPTKSLVREKFLELKRYYPDTQMRTGDSILENYKKVKGEVIVSTYEHLVYSFRNFADWTKDISCIVFDEIHQIAKKWILEEAITYALERGIPILGLSATLPSYKDIASWIGSDLVIYSEWRPVPLERDTKSLTNFLPTRRYEDKDLQVAARLLNATFELSDREESVIVFVPQKKIGWKMLEVAQNEKIGIVNRTTPFEIQEEREPEIAFHNADVPKEERDDIERAFREGKIKKLIATQTLAYGVNLPADRVIILVRMFPNRGSWRCIPDTLDILQMEGRAGRLGIKDVGYSHILTYGGSTEKLIYLISCALKDPISKDKRVDEDTLSIFTLLGFLYEGRHYRRFLEKTYSLRHLKDEQLKKTVEFLSDKGYIKDGRLTQKALYCIKSGIPPTRFEEFLRRLSLKLEPLAVIRPLLHMKKFDSLYDFVQKGESFEEDSHYVASKLTLCGVKCFLDNTHQFLFYTEGLTFKYTNISNPPGEFSYLGTDALHLLRTLIELQKLGIWNLSDEQVLCIAHSVKYGISLNYASLSGLKGIGHIRSNLLKYLMREEGLLAPPIGSRVEDLIERLKELNLEKELKRVLSEVRKLSSEKSKEEVKRVLSILRNNRKGFLVDDRILLAFGLFKLGERAFKMKKEELVRELLWNLPNRSSP